MNPAPLSNWNPALLLTLSCLLMTPTFSQDTDVSGTVRDVEGHPLANVLVTGLHHFPAGGIDELRAKTEENGRFELKSVGRVFFFVAPKFEALTDISQEPSLDVTLKPAVEDRWPTACSARSESGKRYGTMFLFLVPRGTKVKRSSGDDTWDLIVNSLKGKEQLKLWSGPMLGDGFVSEETVLEASSFTQHGFDWRGRCRDGTNWRWHSASQDLIHYEHASDDAAHFFDRIIDSVCVRQFPSESATKRAKE